MNAAGNRSAARSSKRSSRNGNRKRFGQQLGSIFVGDRDFLWNHCRFATVQVVIFEAIEAALETATKKKAPSLTSPGSGEKIGLRSGTFIREKKRRFQPSGP